MASLRKRGDGWELYWRMGGAGTRKQAATFHDEDDAVRAKKLVEAHSGLISRDEVYRVVLELPAEETPQSTKPTLREWSKTWIKSRSRPSPGTKGGYQSHLDNGILPVLGDMHLDLIAGTDIGSWAVGMRVDANGRRRKNSTITRYYSTLHACLAAAVLEGLIDRNPCDASGFERDVPDHDDDDSDGEYRVYLTPAQYRRLRGEVPAHHRPLLDVLVGTGVRWAEGTALAVEHARPTAGTGRGPRMVHVRRAWKKDAKQRKYLGIPKGKQRRSVPAPKWLEPTLDQLCADRPKTAFLVTTANGKPYHYPNFYAQVWAPAVTRAMCCPLHPPANRGGPVPEGVDPGRLCKDHGGTKNDGTPCSKELVPGTTRCVWHSGPAPDAVSGCDCPDVLHERCTPHDLRHTYASWWLASSSGDMRVLQQLLGHKSITTTEIYGKLQPGSEQSWADQMDRFWRRSLPASGRRSDAAAEDSAGAAPRGGSSRRRRAA